MNPLTTFSHAHTAECYEQMKVKAGVLDREDPDSYLMACALAPCLDESPFRGPLFKLTCQKTLILLDFPPPDSARLQM